MPSYINCPVCDEESTYDRECYVLYEIGYVHVKVHVCEGCHWFLVNDAAKQLRKSRIRDTIRLLRGKDKL